MKFRKPKDLSYLAGAFEERAEILPLENGNFRVSFRSRGILPRFLKKEFGGSVFYNGRQNCLWYRAQGKNAVRLLEAVLPYLKMKAKSVKRFLALWKKSRPV